MINVTYELLEEEYIVNNAYVVSYGIVAYSDSANNSILAYISNISNNKEKILAFVQRCNILKLSSIHLYDAIEDLLGE